MKNNNGISCSDCCVIKGNDISSVNLLSSSRLNINSCKNRCAYNSGSIACFSCESCIAGSCCGSSKLVKNKVLSSNFS